MKKERSEAQKRADKKYNDKIRGSKYMPLNLSLLTIDKLQIDNYCKLKNISKAQFIVRCCKYFMQRDEIPLDDNINNSILNDDNGNIG